MCTENRRTYSNLYFIHYCNASYHGLVFAKIVFAKVRIALDWNKQPSDSLHNSLRIIRVIVDADINRIPVVVLEIQQEEGQTRYSLSFIECII
jgi:hypothetical protein